jgi:hypothetical protein
MRAAAQNAIERREAELTESLEAAEGLLQAEEAKRSSVEQALRQRVEVMAALRKHGADLLTGHAELRAESAVSGRTP